MSAKISERAGNVRSPVARLGPFERVGRTKSLLEWEQRVANFSATMVTGETGSVKGETKSANF